MKYFKFTSNSIIAGVGTDYGEIEITEAEYNEILDLIRNKPKAEIGYDYRLKTDLTWELCELPIVEQPNTYTAEQLAEMTNAELSVICAELGISGSMTKANMIALILDKQNNIG